MDDGLESIAQKLKDWYNKNEIALYYIQSGKPTQKSLVEGFNRIFRTEFLDVYLFENIRQMRNYSEI
ncbi:integrase core domain-containing protein [Chryseobacterium sp. NRRL B-14798]|uniref:integrase core domain-containing protein n=1 Tax=Chryseobacterium sp. NRRL B-14798 TaxID=3162880 RepID=UPI003D1F01D8